MFLLNSDSLFIATVYFVLFLYQLICELYCVGLLTFFLTYLLNKVSSLPVCVCTGQSEYAKDGARVHGAKGDDEEG